MDGEDYAPLSDTRLTVEWAGLAELVAADQAKLRLRLLDSGEAGAGGTALEYDFRMVKRAGGEPAAWIVKAVSKL